MTVVQVAFLLLSPPACRKGLSPNNPPSPTYPLATSQLWAWLPMMNLNGLVTPSPGEPHRNWTLEGAHQEDKAEEPLVCISSFDYPSCEDTHTSLKNAPRWTLGFRVASWDSVQPIPVCGASTGTSPQAGGSHREFPGCHVIFDILKALN